MAWYSVYIEIHGDDLTAVTDKAIFGFADVLVPHHGIASGGQAYASYGATISVDAGTAVLAVTEGAAIVQRLAADAGLPGWPIVRAEAVREDVLDEDLALAAVSLAASDRGGAGSPGDEYGFDMAKCHSQDG